MDHHRRRRRRHRYCRRPPTTSARTRCRPCRSTGSCGPRQSSATRSTPAGGSTTPGRPVRRPVPNLTPRGNLLAYDITTGNLVTSFNPSLNGQVLSVTASPDGSRIYVVGDFTTANGQARRRVAAYSTATGALITAFNPVGRELAGPGGDRHQRHRLRRWRLPGRRRWLTRRGTWPPSGPRTAPCSTGTPTPTTTCGRSRSPKTARRCSPVARSRTSAASRPMAWPRSMRRRVR